MLTAAEAGANPGFLGFMLLTYGSADIFEPANGLRPLNTGSFYIVSLLAIGLIGLVPQGGFDYFGSNDTFDK